MNGIHNLIKNLALSPTNITLDIIVILIAITANIFINKFLNKKYKENHWKIPKGFLYSLIWLFTLIIIALITIKEFENLIILKNKYLKLTAFNLTVIFIIINANLFLIRFIKLQSMKKLGVLKNKTLRTIVDIIIWLLTIHIIAKIIFPNYSKISKYKLFTISKVNITIYDIFFILITIAITIAIIVSLQIFFNKLIEKKKLEKGTAYTIYKISQYIIWIFVILFILQGLGFNISLLLASSAALLVGLGIGIQQIFGDIISGIIILFERKINVGDIVEVDKLVGKVIELGFRTTTILTRDDIQIIIPNSKLTSGNIINWSKGKPITRFYVQVGVAYGSDIQLVEKLLIEATSKNPKISRNPKPTVIFSDFGDSSLNFKLYFYTKDSFNVEEIKSDIRKKIDNLFRKHNISIPFPQRDIHIYNQSSKNQ